MRHVLLLLSLIVLPSAPSRVAEGGFSSVLEKVETLMDVGRWGPAKKLLFSELEKRAGDTEVIAHLADVREVLERCSFGADYKPTRPADVVAGELVKFLPTRDQVHLRYAPKDGAAPADFMVPGPGEEVWLHPLVWNGPFTIRVRGSSLRETVSVIACTDEAGGFVVQCDQFLALARVRSESEGELIGEPVSIDEGARYELEIHVQKRNLEVLFNGSRVASSAKPGDMFGYCGFTSFEGIESIELEGRAELSWIQRQVDDASALARLQYEETYDPKADLPAWLRPYDLSDEPEREEQPFEGFEGVDESILARASSLAEWQDDEAGLAFAESLQEGQADARLRSWMRALFLARLGRDAEALEALDESLAIDRGHLQSRRLHALLLWKVRDRGAGLEASRSLIDEFPARAEPYEDLARTLLLNGRPAEVRDVLERARVQGVRSGSLQFVERVLARAARGPMWSRTHEYTSRHYVVRSDISRELCLEAAQALDGSYRMFEMRLGRIENKGATRLPVYLFSGQGGYLLYTRELLGALPVHTAGVYSPAMQQLLIWNLPERADMLRTVRHEGFHQFLDQRVGAAPVWLHEGLAEYFASSRLERGRWAHGDELEYHLTELRDPDFSWTPLAEFLQLDSQGFYAGAARSYAEAWHWVHFLENSGVVNGRRVRALVDSLAAGKSERAALDAAFPPEDLAELERARRAHLAAR